MCAKWGRTGQPSTEEFILECAQLPGSSADRLFPDSQFSQLLSSSALELVCLSVIYVFTNSQPQNKEPKALHGWALADLLRLISLTVRT